MEGVFELINRQFVKQKVMKKIIFTPLGLYLIGIAICLVFTLF